MDTQARARSAITLAVLAVVFSIGVAWAWAAVTEPFPEKEDPPICVETSYADGDRMTPGDIVVNVLNASSTEGLARETMEALVRKGFVEGSRSNTAAKTGKGSALIWTGDPDGAPAQLLKTYFGPGAEVMQQSTTAPGISVIVGEGFPGIQDGKKSIKAKDDGTVCSPPDQG